MIKCYAVFYNNILSGLYKQSGALAIFSDEAKADEFASEMNAINHGYSVKEIEIKITKSRKRK
jgi:hypothetical protein